MNTYLTIGDHLPEEIAFGFLDDLRKLFLRTYTKDVIEASYSYKLTEFNKEIKNLAVSNNIIIRYYYKLLIGSSSD